ncbi:MAG: group II intron reverse transcriptase/maturase [Candidatus Bipolaricaulota bacterium]
MKALRAAFERVKRNRGAAGVDHVTVEMFAAHLDENLGKLSRSLVEGTYQPQAIRRRWIPKAGSKEKRPLGIPTVRDRVVPALRNVVEPIFERDFAQGSYGFRPGRGCHDALRRVEELLGAGHTWVVDVDLRSFFDTMSHEALMERVRQKVADGKALSLIEAFLGQEVMDGLEGWEPEEGTPQGAVISPLLSNIYLDLLDHRMAEKGVQMIRYADDFVILCRSKGEAWKALREVQEWATSVGLSLRPEKTRIVAATQRGGFDFLGYHFERGYKWPREKSAQKLKDAVREQTKRTNGHSLDAIIFELNGTLRGWFEYFKHSHPTTFPHLDSWVRMRLRSILRKRQGRKGRGAGWDNQRWTNDFFVACGLFSLVAAHQAIRQSSTR